MSGLRNVGAAIAADRDLVYQDYVDLLKGNELSTEEIDDAINAGLTSYASRTYVDDRDALLATTAYVNAQDNLRVKLASREVPNGVAGLDATSKLNPARINAPNTQQYHRGPWSPSAYNAQTTAAAETTLYTCGVTDPGYPYRLVVFGEVDARSDVDTEHSVVYVRLGSASGTIIGVGQGANDSQDVTELAHGDDFERPDANNLGPGWEQTYATNPDGTGGDNGSGGRLGINDGRAYWPYAGLARRCHARAIDPAFAQTGSDRQGVFVRIGGNGDPEFGSQGRPAFRLYTRVNADFTSYVAIHNTSPGSCSLVYRSPTSDGEQVLATAPSGQPSNNELIWLTAGEYDLDMRRFRYYRHGSNTPILDFTDNTGLTVYGPNNRGWGFMQAPAAANLGQTKPPDFESIWVNDMFRNYAPVIVVPQNLHSMPVQTGATTLYIRALNTGAGISTLRNYRPKLHVMAYPA